MFERFTDPARQVVVLAQKEALGLGHDYLGTEHILLALLRYEDGIPARVLSSRGVTAEAVRARVVEIVGRGEGGTTGQMPFAPRAKHVLETAMREADDMGHAYIGTEHVLLGLLRDDDGVAIRILTEFASPADLRADVLRTLSGEPPSRRTAPRAAAASTRIPLLPLVVGSLLFATALGVGILIGWAIWG